MEQPGATLARAAPRVAKARLRPLPPVEFPAWTKTRDDLAAAIGRGSGVVALVGAEGSGKTLTLKARPPASLSALDLVDGVDRAALARLAAGRPFPGVRVLAVRPDLLAALVDAFPDAQIVRMRPMASPDVAAMLEARREQAGRPPDTLAPRAIRRLEELCHGNPRCLDRLLGRADLVARAAGAGQISAEHVDTAARRAGTAPRASAPTLRPIRPKAQRPGSAAQRPASFGARSLQAAIAGRRPAYLAGTILAASAAAFLLWSGARRSPDEAPRTIEATTPVPPASPTRSAPVRTDLAALDPVVTEVPTTGEMRVTLTPAPPAPIERLLPSLAPPPAPPPALATAPVPQPMPAPASAPAPETPPAVEVTPPPPAPTIFVRVPRPAGPPTGPGPLAELPRPAPAPVPDAAMEPFVAQYQLSPPPPPPPPAPPAASPPVSPTPDPVIAAAPAPETSPAPAAQPTSSVPETPPAVVTAEAPATPPQPPTQPAPPPLVTAEAPATPPTPPTQPAPPPVAARQAPPEPPPAPATPPTIVASLTAGRPGDPEKAARLFTLGRTMISIGQLADAREMLRASAALGHQEAATLMATLPRPPAARPALR